MQIAYAIVLHFDAADTEISFLFSVSVLSYASKHSLVIPTNDVDVSLVMECAQFHNYKHQCVTFGSRCIFCSYLLRLILHHCSQLFLRASMLAVTSNSISLASHNVILLRFLVRGEGQIEMSDKYYIYSQKS